MKKSLIFGIALMALLAGSCTSLKKIIYLQDMEVGVPYDVAPRPDIRITENDRIKIVVTCSEPALATPFNLSTGTFFIDPMTGEMSSSPVSLNESGYLVDKNGCINFPVFGYLYVEGLTLKEVEEYITQKIIDSKYIKEPIVLADFLNFQYTVLGEMGVGNFTVNGNSINILQAIAQSGDVTDVARRDDVWVVRTENGERMVYSVNLLSKDLYDSPVFYLQQNDLIYVKPKRTFLNRMRESSQNLHTFLSLFSATASIISMLYLTGVIGNDK